MARKKPGAYVALSAHYADDDRIMAAGEEAELLYVRALAYCARTPKTEGHLTFAQVKTRLGLDGAESRAETCAEVGLLTRTDTGYQIASWLKWNLSAEEIDRVRAQDRNRKGTPLTSTKSGKESGSRSGNEGVKETGIPVPYTETDTEVKNRGAKRSTQMPKDWQPKDEHLAIAREYGLDPAYELRAFKDRNEAKGTLYKNWDAAFRTWLNQAKTFRGNSHPPYSASAASPVSRKHLPTEVPDHIDPDDTEAYAKWAREATQ